MSSGKEGCNFWLVCGWFGWFVAGLASLWMHCTKNHIFFFQMFRKDDISKIIALEYDLSCIIRKDDISFSQKYDLISLDGKGKMIFLKKNTWKYDVFFKCSEKMVLSKKITLEYDLFCNIWKDGYSFFPKI